MPDIDNNIITPEEENQEQDYIQIIQDLKGNTVSKDKYNRLAEENKRLMTALANGEKVEVEAPEKPDIDILRAELYTDNVQKLSDIQMIQKTLELRKAIMDEGGDDPFVPHGRKVVIEQSDYDTAERVADVLQQCIDYADGDNAVFVNEMQRRTVDTMVGARGKRR